MKHKLAIAGYLRYGYIDWSWWLVMMPMWGLIGLNVLAFGILMAIAWAKANKEGK